VLSESGKVPPVHVHRIAGGPQRRGAEGECARLEPSWRDAEGVAAIADDLMLPEPVPVALRKLMQE